MDNHEIYKKSLIQMNRQFIEQTENNQDFQDYWKKLMQFDNYCNPDSETKFQNFEVSGCLKKKVQKEKLFQRQAYPRRFLKMSFKQNTLQLYYKEGGDESKCYHFKQIRGFWIPNQEREKQIQQDCSPKFPYPFFVNFDDRQLCLFSQNK